MNILYALDSYKPNIDGVAVSIERQALALIRWNHRVSIVAPSVRWDEYQEWDGPIRVYRVRSVRVVQEHRMAVASRDSVNAVLDQVRPNVVVAVLPFPLSRQVVSLARERGIPVVGISGTVPEWVLYNAGFVRPMWKLVQPLVWSAITGFYNQCDWVVGVTETAVRLLKKGGLKRPARVISNGVDLDLFRPRPRHEGLVQRLGIPRKPTVLYTGRLDPDKCMDVWVNAVPHVLERVDAHFIIGGNGTDKPRLQNLVEKMGLTRHVTFAGFLDSSEYPDIYSLADVFAISSPTELQSIVTLEAAASELPIVAVNAGALPELVHHGRNGFLFARDNSREMGEALAILLKDPALRRQMGQESRRIAQAHDLWQAMRAYEALYSAVSAGSSPPLEPVMAAVQSEARAPQ